jgi:hypothetical protein
MINREQASIAGLFAAILFFALAVGTFVALNVYWPVMQTITKPAPGIRDNKAVACCWVIGER